jgi:hypothetical protein
MVDTTSAATPKTISIKLQRIVFNGEECMLVVCRDISKIRNSVKLTKEHAKL